MTGLSPEEIKALTRKDDQRIVSSNARSRWLTQSDCVVLLNVMDKGGTSVHLGGELFTVSYESRDKAYVKPAKHGKFWPCGWYTRKLLESIVENS